MKIRVLQVGKYFYPERGGMETYLFNLCQGLKNEVDSKVLVSNTSARTVREVVKGVEVIRAGRWAHLFSAPVCPAFPFLMKRLVGDIVQVLHPNPLAAISYLLIRPEGRLIVVYQSDIVRQRLTDKLYRPFLIKFLRMADRIIVTSPNYLKNSPILGRFREKCVIIPLGIDLSLYEKKAAGRQELEAIRKQYGSRIVLFIGRLTSYKGLEYLIQAMEEVKGQLLVIGRGERFHRLSSLVERKKLGAKVRFLGEISEEKARLYLYACSALCLPSVTRNEAFGIVQLEAMACSKPVVSTRLGTGVDYVNQDGVTGILVPPRDVEALAEALNRLLADDKLREELGRRGRQRVEGEFGKEMMARDTLKLYRELL